MELNLYLLLSDGSDRVFELPICRKLTCCLAIEGKAGRVVSSAFSPLWRAERNVVFLAY